MENSISNSASEKNPRQRWIDFAKGVAMIAVVVDHSVGIVYTTPWLHTLSFFSVTLFILVAGYNAFLSMERRALRAYSWNYVARRVWGLFLPYMVATAVTLIWQDRFFDLSTFLRTVLTFSAQGPFYFVLVFLQLLVAAPVLYLAIKRIQKSGYGALWTVFFLAALYLLSYVFVRFTFILPVHGGGKYLFGGSYLFVFALGLVLGTLRAAPQKRRRLPLFLGLGAALVLYVIFVYLSPAVSGALDSFLPEMSFNPPGLTLILYAVLIFAVIWAAYLVLEKTKAARVLVPVEWCGRYSLEIFFYHLIALSIGQAIVADIPQIQGNVLVRIGLFVFALVLPILGRLLINVIKSALAGSSRRDTA